MKLSDMQLFRGLEEDDISSLLSCLNSVKRNYKKGEVILSEGSIIENIGIVLSGMAMISCNDIWGNTGILGSVAPGSVFAEVYACIPGQPMLVTVSAVEDTSVLFMNVGRVLTTCTNACPFHTNLARNLLTVCAHKSLQLSQRILHTSSKSIRGRLMSYFSKQSCRCSPYRLPRQSNAAYSTFTRNNSFCPGTDRITVGTMAMPNQTGTD